MTDPRPARYSPTIMHAFRAAFEAKDARKRLDLRDEAGERIVASRRLPHRYGARDQILKDELARDVTNLLNTVNLGSSVDLSDLPHVEGSILNYGLADPTAAGSEESVRARLAADIHARLLHYEPRLVAGTLAVEPRPDQDNEAANAMSFTVAGELHARPVNIGIEFIADLEPGSQTFSVKRLALR